MQVPIIREDPWFWLRDDKRMNEEVLTHLRKENAFAEASTKHLDSFRKLLYDEHISHLKQTDDVAPHRHGDWFYYTRTVEGLSYKIHCRKPAVALAHVPTEDANEQILLDENKVAQGQKQCVIQGVRVSPDHTRLVYGVDLNGSEMYDLVVICIATGKTLDTIKNVSDNTTWATNDVLFYVTKDETQRAFRVHVHTIGHKQDDVKNQLFEEQDKTMDVGVSRSRSGRFVYLETASKATTEIHYCDLDKGQRTFTVIQPRQKNLRYEVDHDGRDGLVVWTNKDDAVHNRLMYAPLASPSQEHWTEIIPYDPKRMISRVDVFKHHLILEGRLGGITRLWALDVEQGRPAPSSLRLLTFDEELYEVETGVNRVFDTTHVRIHYSSLTTPTRYLDYEMKANAAKPEILIKEQPVLNFDRTKYTCKQIFATAPDKTKIPVSMVYRKELSTAQNTEKNPLGGVTRPCFLYGYGSYGICIDPGFVASILPYLDRGVVYCIAHIRGGGEMGRYWYEEQGKYLQKRNTFSDFIACAEHLIEHGYTSSDLLAIEGRSAGGLLMGNVVNMRPDLFKVVLAGVPFVDLMTTMSDPSIPLTCEEWEEWGNPNAFKYHDYMMSYCPISNVRAQGYPNILITAGLYDPRVAYWEPTKWASKIRSLKTDNNEVLLKMDLDAGHFSASDRYKYLREKSFDQAYVMDKLGLTSPSSKL